MKRFCEHLCPNFQAAMDVLAKPWNGFIIAALGDGPQRFGELLERLQAVGDRMLAARLKELAERGVIERRTQAGPPARVTYELTEVGQDFARVADAIGSWGERLVAAAPAPKRRARR